MKAWYFSEVSKKLRYGGKWIILDGEGVEA